MNKVNLPSVDYDLVRLLGGMDQITPTLSLKPGIARRAANFECSLNGGYTRIAGYERFDGRPNPSDATYNILTITISAAIAVGNTITGATSAATGKVIAIDGSDYVITRETGTFTAGENVTVSAVVKGVVSVVVGVAADGLEDATYKSLAAADYRADIGVVPGSGNVLGVAQLNGIVYAWRANAGNTAVDLYKESAAGWVQVTLGKELRFTAGVAAGIADGNTVTGFTSGATGVVARVVVESGSFAGGTAAGRLILSSTTGTFSAAESIRVGGTNRATASGAQTQITLSVGGRYETTIANFGGGTVNRKLYGIDGVNKAFEFDGTTYVPIVTTMVPDVPTRVAFHKQHLFLAFGSSLQFSSIAAPYEWDPVTGAGELAMNDDITVLQVLPGDQTSGAIAVYTASDLSVLYGTSAATFQLSPFNVGTGAIAYTGQNLDQTYVLAERGVMGLGTTLNFGNFASTSLTMNLRPFIQARRTLASASIVNREKGQYRVFFSDGYGLYLTISNGQFVGAMPVQLTHAVLCSTEAETADGSETSYFGSSNGYVYRLDAGTSFDGGEIPANFNLVPNSIRSPRVLKRFRHASVELTGDSYATFEFGYDLAYRSTNIQQAAETTHENDLRSANYDEMVYDNFVYDGSELTPSEIQMTGTGENVAIRISSVSAILKPFTVNSIIVHYTQRRGKRQ